MGAKTYSPKKVVGTLGPCILRGFADGSMIKVAYNADRFSESVGSDGEVTRVESANKTGTATISLAQSSQANDELSALALSGAVVPFLLRDMNGTTVAFSANAWVRKPADSEFAKDAAPREWSIALEELELYNGGILRGSLL